MKTKSTTDKPFACEAWSERQAHMALAQTIEQNKQDDRRAQNHQGINDESERKESINMQFWHRVWVSCNTLLVMIILYAAYQFFVR